MKYRPIVEEMKLIDIAKHITRTYPDSCLAWNCVVDQCDVVNEDYAKDILIDEILDFFACEKLYLCSCGCPEDTWEVIRRVLTIQSALHDQKVNYDQFKSMRKEALGLDSNDDIDNGILQFILYTLDNCGLLEHGSSIGSAWLTLEGEMYLKALDIWHEREEADNNG